MDRLTLAARMMGQWWAERLNLRYEQYQPAVTSAIAVRVVQVALGQLDWKQVQTRPGIWEAERCPGRARSFVRTRFDYDPDDLLADALKEAIPGITGTDMHFHTFPRKHTLLLAMDVWVLEPKEGYANDTAVIPVPEEIPA